MKDKILYTLGFVFERLIVRNKYFQNLSQKRLFADQIVKKGFDTKNLDKYLLFKKRDFFVQLRLDGSDSRVFDQIFIRGEYDPILDFFVINKTPLKTMIDAGCNIGLTTLKFIEIFPEARILCLEPDLDNFKMMNLNLKDYTRNVTLINSALWNKEEKLFMDFGFRDKKDWSRRVSDSPKSSSSVFVDGISMQTLMSKYNLTEIDFLKIDIEGGEETIFRESNLSFLNATKLIAIEIHDEFNCREMIYDKLKSHGFILMNSGELTIGFNMLKLFPQ